jgi:hypothetical protein
MASTKSSESFFPERLSRIPQHLRIRILYSDDDVVVIDKPGNLRSVPGHANKPPPTHKRKRPTVTSNSQDNYLPDDTLTLPPARRTGHEAWVLAIRSFEKTFVSGEDNHPQHPTDTPNDDDDWMILTCLSRLAQADSVIESVPRKYKLFRKFVERNQRRWITSDPLMDFAAAAATTNTTTTRSRLDSTELDRLSQAMFQQIEVRQRPLLNLPEPTRHEDSALGQLILMEYDATTSTKNTVKSHAQPSHKRFLVVHRLDCEVGSLDCH